MREGTLTRLRNAIAQQEAWMISCGGSRAGYVARYGSPGTAYCYGNGGEAIWQADHNELQRLIGRYEKVRRREVPGEF